MNFKTYTCIYVFIYLFIALTVNWFHLSHTDGIVSSVLVLSQRCISEKKFIVFSFIFYFS